MTDQAFYSNPQHVHIERMDDDFVWLEIVTADGTRVHHRVTCVEGEAVRWEVEEDV